MKQLCRLQIDVYKVYRDYQLLKSRTKMELNQKNIWQQQARIIKGVFKIDIKSIQLERYFHEKDITFIKVRLGTHESNYRFRKNKLDFLGPSHYFEGGNEEKLVVTLYNKDLKDKYIGYGEVLITPLAKMPNVDHQVTLKTVYRDDGKVILKHPPSDHKKQDLKESIRSEKKLQKYSVAQSAKIVLNIFYMNKFEETLEVNIVEGDLTHDTEALGKMDPYAVLKIGQTVEKTAVLEDRGKFPVWNECKYFQLKNTLGIMELSVFDKQFLSSDKLVGSASINLREEGYLKQSVNCEKHIVEIWYIDEDKIKRKGGLISIQTRLRPMKPKQEPKKL